MSDELGWADTNDTVRYHQLRTGKKVEARADVTEPYEKDGVLYVPLDAVFGEYADRVRAIEEENPRKGAGGLRITHIDAEKKVVTFGSDGAEEES